MLIEKLHEFHYRTKELTWRIDLENMLKNL